MKRGRLVIVEDEDNTHLSSTSAHSSARLVKVDAETGHVEIFPARKSLATRHVAPESAHEDAFHSDPPGIGEVPATVEESNAILFPVVGKPSLCFSIIPMLFLFAVLLFAFRLCRARERLRRTGSGAGHTCVSRQILAAVLTPLTFTNKIVKWCLEGHAAGLDREGDVREQAERARRALDRALARDEALGARDALRRLSQLAESPDFPLWMREIADPLEEEAWEVEEREEYQDELVRGLTAAMARCEEALGATRQRLSHQAHSCSLGLGVQRGMSPTSLVLSLPSAAGDQEMRLVGSLEKVGEYCRGTGEAASRQARALVEEGESLLKRWFEAQDSPILGALSQDEVSAPFLTLGPGSVSWKPTPFRDVELIRDRVGGEEVKEIVKSGDQGEKGASERAILSRREEAAGDPSEETDTRTATGGRAETEVVWAQEEAEEDRQGATRDSKVKQKGDGGGVGGEEVGNGSLLSHTLLTGVREGTERGMVVMGGGSGLLSVHREAVEMDGPVSLLGAFKEELRRHAGAVRMVELQRTLEGRGHERRQRREESRRAAEAERLRRLEGLRERGKDLMAVRACRAAGRLEAQEARRAGDQALFTYLLPVSLVAFGLLVWVASLEEEMEGRRGPSLLLGALWRVPIHDLLYGDCLGPSPTPSSTVSRVVQHHVKRFPGADRPTLPRASTLGLETLARWLDLALPSSISTGVVGALEATGCYARRTLWLATNAGMLVLLHFVVGSLGLGPHRAKMHVAILLFCLKNAFARVTWRGLSSVRSILGFHFVLFALTAWKGFGRSFAHRHFLFRRLIPLLAVMVGLLDGAIYVGPAAVSGSLQALRAL
ncbi:hypothetical protein Naga_100011g66 [Nannochloropsis gaditana]|uniref:Uncharacterized protein n=1 Tax=Nannochloropsis gaditana TaxID=72520 RepID=W7T7N4_9STRA|nr:hypothetical protein Naga_100011g66 [Nannochloropsis gaditana]